MKRYLLIAAVAMMATLDIYAQSLAGRTYYNANIMAEKMNGMMKDLDKKMAETKNEAIAEFEKKKKRKPNAAEMAEIDKKMKEARTMAETMKKGMTTKMTVEFKTEKNMVMKADMKIDEAALKATGIGWLKRKALKAAMAIAPSSSKATYTVKGNLILVQEDDDKDLDTLRMSSDGKYLYGKFDGDEFKLTRTK